MADPLAKSQQSLRAKKVSDMTDEQLREWIDACTKMELHLKPAKARHAWKSAGVEAEAEVQKRSGQAQE